MVGTKKLKSEKALPKDVYSQVLKKEIGVEVVREYQFDSVRRFRFDYAIPDHHVAIEIDGGLWMEGGGRHNRANGFINDMEKLNLAASQGWRVLRFTHSNKFQTSNLNLILATINY